MSKKTTDAEVTQRVATVYKMLLQGLTKQDIVHYSSENWFVSERTVETYIQRATIEIGKVTDEEKSAALGSALKRLNTMLFKALKKDDLKTALAIQKEINDLYHLKDSEDKNSNSTINITFTNGEEKAL